LHCLATFAQPSEGKTTGVELRNLTTPDHPTDQVEQHIQSYFKLAVTSTNHSFLNAGWVADSRRRLGAGAGLGIDWPLSFSYSILTQIEYLQKGSAIGYAATDGESPSPARWSTSYAGYLSVPVLLKCFVNTWQPRPFVMGGFRVDRLVDFHGEMTGQYVDFRKTILGSAIGIGAQLDGGIPFDIIVEARYNFDLQNSYTFNGGLIRNNAFDIWVGIDF
jgi:hypothetical protein